MSKKGTLFIVDDDDDILTTARIVLRPFFNTIKTFETPEQFLHQLSNEHVDVALIDMNFSIGDTSARDGINLLETLRSKYPFISVVTSTAYGDINLAVESIKKGATDFVVKPWDNDKLSATLTSARDLAVSKYKIDSLENKQKALIHELDKTDSEILGISHQIQTVISTIEKVAKTDANVIILGENGTGKSLAARVIHKKSARSENPFISVDLGSISESLFESEMFGHKKGAFTDAKQDRVGRFELSDKSTLFLDEIGNIPISTQAKLLTTIENKCISPVGSNEVIPIDTRIISATNMSIYDSVKNGTFREDLLYRLNIIEITIPPLRERTEDIPIIAKHTLEKLSKKYNKEILSLSSNALNKLMKYNWPGNIRELNHALERAVILAESEILESSDFHISQTLDTNKKPQTLEEIEKESIKKSILSHQGNLSKVSKELGMGRTTLYRKIEKYGL